MHWTYTKFKPDDGLFQGDIIARDPVLELLKTIHPHFCDPKYLAFAIISQTCDLFVRGGQCKTRYVNLAVIRPLASLLSEVLPEIAMSAAPGVFCQETREKADQFIHRTINQNEQAHGLFYLHPDVDSGVGESSVILLRVNIALRTREHYQRLKESRVGRLDTEYRNKLGWLVGNLYSRVDTTDWAERPDGEETAKKLARQLLDGSQGSQQNYWIPASTIESARKAGVNFGETDRKKLADQIRQHTPDPAKRIAIDRVRQITRELVSELSKPVVLEFEKLVDRDTILAELVTDSLAEFVDKALEDTSLAKSIAIQLMSERDVQSELLGVFSSVANQLLAGEIAIETDQTRADTDVLRLTHYVEQIMGLPVCSANIAERICTLMSDKLGSSVANDQIEYVRNNLPSSRYSERTVDRLRELLQLAADSTLDVRIEKRLRNDMAFNGCLK